MSDYMKEAERRLAEHEHAAGLSRYGDCQTTRAALLAHIQRGAVPDVDWLSNVIRTADGSHNLGAGALAEKIVEAMIAAPAPDHFRDTAQIGTEEGGEAYTAGYFDGDAAGYARGRAEAGMDADSRGMFVARLEKMSDEGHADLTVQEVLALLNDCDMLAARDCSALRGEVKP